MSLGWKKLRSQVLERDNSTCQYCKRRPKNPHVHHIIPRMYGGIDVLDNLVTLCQSCHIPEDYKIKMKYKTTLHHNIQCNGCKSNNVIKAGLKQYSRGKRQRYYCSDCFKYFNGDYVNQVGI